MQRGFTAMSARHYLLRISGALDVGRMREIEDNILVDSVVDGVVHGHEGSIHLKAYTGPQAEALMKILSLVLAVHLLFRVQITSSYA